MHGCPQQRSASLMIGRTSDDYSVSSQPLAQRESVAGTSEHRWTSLSYGRKADGVLVSVTPCLQIAAIARSPQVLMFLLSTRELFPCLKYAIYDNACAVVRHLRSQGRECAPVRPSRQAWKLLRQIQWAIDWLRALPPGSAG